jgi:hypothetical protein
MDKMISLIDIDYLNDREALILCLCIIEFCKKTPSSPFDNWPSYADKRIASIFEIKDCDPDGTERYGWCYVTSNTNMKYNRWFNVLIIPEPYVLMAQKLMKKLKKDEENSVILNEENIRFTFFSLKHILHTNYMQRTLGVYQQLLL